MNISELKDKVVSGIWWSYAERISAQSVNFLVSIILARWLTPNEFGLLALVTAILDFFQVLTGAGFGTALVQKKDADQLDYSTILWAGVFFQSAIFWGLWMAAPLVADYYRYPQLVWLLRVVAFRLPLLAINSVQHAFVQKRMDFRKFFFSTFIGTVLSAIVGISLAYSGAGVWALVAQYMTNSLIDTIVLFISTRWHPSLFFSWKRLKPLLSFGGYIMVAGIVGGLTNQLRGLVIGKKFSPADLAYYDRGNAFPNVLNANINGVLGSVLFPAFSSMNDDIPRMKGAMRRAIHVSVYLLAPLMAILGVVADPLVRVLLTEKWLGAVPFIPVFCLHGMMNTVNSVSSQMVKALGKSKAYSFGGILQSSVQLVLLVIVVVYSNNVYYIALVAIASIFSGNVYMMYLNSKYVDYTVRQQIMDLVESGRLAVIMALAVSMIGLYNFQDALIKLIVQCLSGILIYIILSVLTRNQTMFYIVSFLRSRFMSKKEYMA